MVLPGGGWGRARDRLRSPRRIIEKFESTVQVLCMPGSCCAAASMPGREPERGGPTLRRTRQGDRDAPLDPRPADAGQAAPTSWPAAAWPSATASSTRARIGWRICSAALGVGIGDRIALMLENHPRYFEICWAAQRAGIVYTAISSRLTAGEAAYIVGDCGAKVFITSDGAGRPGGRTAGPARPSVQHAADARRRDRRLPAPTRRRWPAARPSRIADESAGGDMLYSSGTTGRPKGVFVPPESTDIAFVSSLLKVCIGPFQHGPGHGVPVAGAAVPRGAAALRDGGDAPGRHGGGDGALRRGRIPAPGAAAPHHAHAGGADDVRAHAQAARCAAPGARPVDPCASPSTPPRRARCR